MVSLLGGPLCGVALLRKPAADWIWANAEGRVCKRRMEARWLYRWTGNDWIYAGHDFYLCSGCGAFHQATDCACTFCGGTLATADG